MIKAACNSPLFRGRTKTGDLMTLGTAKTLDSLDGKILEKSRSA